MNDLHLPHDLAAFEAELQSLPRPTMPRVLRQRVLADLSAELSSSPVAHVRTPTPSNLSTRWWFAACAATVAMLWLNLSLVAARSSGDAWQQAASLPPAVTFVETQAALVTLLPELSPADAQRYALTLYSGSQATLLPVPSAAESPRPFAAEAN